MRMYSEFFFQNSNHFPLNPPGNNEFCDKKHIMKYSYLTRTSFLPVEAVPCNVGWRNVKRSKRLIIVTVSVKERRSRTSVGDFWRKVILTWRRKWPGLVIITGACLGARNNGNPALKWHGHLRDEEKKIAFSSLKQLHHSLSNWILDPECIHLTSNHFSLN